jgi:opacity protein-like surface antigen
MALMPRERGFARRAWRAVVLAALAGAALAASAWAQEDFVPEGETYVIDNPSAWTRLRGEYGASIGVEPFVMRGEIGILDYLTVGVSYGGADVFGTGSPTMNPRPGFQAKFRITNGGPILPAISVGYDDQGHGKYYDFNPRYPGENRDYDRYQFKAKGFYLVFSQEIEVLGALGLHLGVSYNLIEDKDDDGVDVYGSLEKTLGPHLVLLGAYSLGLNDDDPDNSLGSGHGYLDAGVRWRVTENFNLEFRFTNLLENQLDTLGEAGGYARRLDLLYVGSF